MDSTGVKLAAASIGGSILAGALLIGSLSWLGSQGPTPQATTPTTAATTAPATTAPPPTPEPTQAPEPEPTPEPSPEPTRAPTRAEGPTGDEIATYLANAATGSPALDATCAQGVRWACNIETITPRGSTLEVRVTKLENPDGDAVARAIYNFLTLTSDSPMPDVSYVQITTATDGMVGSHRG